MATTEFLVILFWVYIVALVILIFLWFRNTYTHSVIIFNIGVIHEYNVSLIDKDEYNPGNYDLMLYRYTEYFWNFFLWGKYSAIRKKYRDMLMNFHTKNKIKEQA